MKAGFSSRITASESEPEATRLMDQSVGWLDQSPDSEAIPYVRDR